MGEYKMVDFDKYCSKCIYEKVKETEDPCNDCLTEPMNVDSNIPVCFKSQED